MTFGMSEKRLRQECALRLFVALRMERGATVSEYPGSASGIKECWGLAYTFASYETDYPDDEDGDRA